MELSDRTNFTILLIDPMEFRRRAIVSEVAEWAEKSAISIKAIAPEDLDERLDEDDAVSHDGRSDPLSDKSIEIVVISPGGVALSSPEVRHWLSAVRTELPDRPLVFLSDRPTADEALIAIRLGAQGLVPLSLPASVVHHAFLFIRDGGTYFPPEALIDVSAGNGDARGYNGASRQGLTQRQIEVLDLLRLGSSNKVIARRLDMQESTVKVHVRQILRKLGAANRTQAALIAADLSRKAEASAEAAQEVEIESVAEDIHIPVPLDCEVRHEPAHPRRVIL